MHTKLGATPTATPVPPTATPVPPTATAKTVLHLGATLDKYLTALPAGFGGIAPAALNDHIAAAKPFIVDVREASEGQTSGVIEGSVNIPIRTLVSSLGKLPTDKSGAIVTYCAVGHRGAIGMMTLQMLGYTNVKNLVGGFTAWTAANFPVKK